MRFDVGKVLIIFSFTVMALPASIFPAQAANHAVILQYHHFGQDTPASTSVSLEIFNQHLAYIKKNGYMVWPLEKIVAYLKNKQALPDKCVAITIDDAYTSVYERSFPRLKEYGFPFTVFVPTEGADRGLKSYMTWKQMKEMQRFGATFASHSHSHAYLIRHRPGESDREWSRRVRNDIELSMKLLKEKLGSETLLFAYPYGEYNAALKKMVQQMNLTAFGQHSGPIWSGSEFTSLPRFPMAGHYAEMKRFVTIIRSLPLPVVEAEPEDPVLADGMMKPVLKLKLAPADYRMDSISCYASEQGKIQYRWLDRKARIMEVIANDPLPAGRSRYNCTAMHVDGNRYFWYSHLWIRNTNKPGG
jgi:peptidoglycan/xylan/chitin deacetylase (PgdA/CDA1 family)